MIGKFTWPVKLAFAELRSEWLFCLGVALSACSVLTPIMLLWGAKTGVVEALRNRLLKDPRTRELICVESNAIPLGWFETMRRDHRVGFVVPSVRLISLYGNALSLAVPGKKSEVSLIPTAPGDPLGDLPPSPDSSRPSQPGACMVSNVVAEELSLRAGSQITLEITRLENDTSIKATFTALVRKVLSSAESKSMAVYLPLSTIERIEDFKDGRDVSVFGWRRGGAPRIESYDSVRVRTAEPARWDELWNASKEAAEQRRLNPPLRVKSQGKDFIEFTSLDNGISAEDVEGLVGGLASFQPLVNLHIDPVKGYTEWSPGTKSEVLIESTDDEWLDQKGVADLLSATTLPNSSNRSQEFDVPNPKGRLSRVILELSSGEMPPSGILRVGAREAGAIGSAERRPVEFISSQNSLRPLRTDYLGFRLYARTLEDVRPLRQQCAKAGIETITQEDRISQVLSLDRGLSTLFMFISLAGLVGGVVTLLTSLYLSIERSKRQFAVLQIIGIPTGCVLMATILEGLIIVLGGAGLSFLLCLGGESLLQKALGDGLQPGEQVCSLGWAQWGLALPVLAVCAIFASLLSSRRLRISDPAVVARSE